MNIDTRIDLIQNRNLRTVIKSISESKDGPNTPPYLYGFFQALENEFICIPDLTNALYIAIQLGDLPLIEDLIQKGAQNPFESIGSKLDWSDTRLGDTFVKVCQKGDFALFTIVYDLYKKLSPVQKLTNRYVQSIKMAIEIAHQNGFKEMEVELNQDVRYVSSKNLFEHPIDLSNPPTLEALGYKIDWDNPSDAEFIRNLNLIYDLIQFQALDVVLYYFPLMYAIELNPNDKKMDANLVKQKLSLDFLNLAIIQSKLEVVNACISMEPNLSHVKGLLRMPDPKSDLHHYKTFSSFEIMLTNINNINVSNPIHVAIQNGQASVLSILVEKGYCLDYALSHAIFVENNEIIDYLLERQVNVNEFNYAAFKMCVSVGNVSLLKRLISLNPNVLDQQGILDIQMDYALRDAVQNGHLDMLNWVLPKVNVEDIFKNMILLQSVESGCVSVFKCLIDHFKTDLTSGNFKVLHTYFRHAILWGQNELLHFFVTEQIGVPNTIESTLNWVLLPKHVHALNSDTIIYLLNLNGALNFDHEKVFTAALNKPLYGVVDDMIEKGWHPQRAGFVKKIKHFSDIPTLKHLIEVFSIKQVELGYLLNKYLAQQNPCYNFVRNLIRKGADVNFSPPKRDTSHESTLSKAIYAGKVDVVELLCEHNAKLLVSEGTGFSRSIQAGSLNVLYYFHNLGVSEFDIESGALLAFFKYLKGIQEVGLFGFLIAGKLKELNQNGEGILKFLLSIKIDPAAEKHALFLKVQECNKPSLLRILLNFKPCEPRVMLILLRKAIVDEQKEMIEVIMSSLNQEWLSSRHFMVNILRMMDSSNPSIRSYIKEKHVLWHLPWWDIKATINKEVKRISNIQKLNKSQQKMKGEYNELVKPYVYELLASQLSFSYEQAISHYLSLTQSENQKPLLFRSRKLFIHYADQHLSNPAIALLKEFESIDGNDSSDEEDEMSENHSKSPASEYSYTDNESGEEDDNDAGQDAEYTDSDDEKEVTLNQNQKLGFK